MLILAIVFAVIMVCKHSSVVGYHGQPVFWAGMLIFFLFFNNLTAAANIALDTNLVRSFIIRTHITLLNKKPQNDDIAKDLPRFFKAADINAEKEKYVDELMALKGFADNIFNIYNSEFLQGADENYIRTEYFVYRAYLSYPSMKDDYPVLEKLVKKLEDLKNAAEDLRNNKITITELQRRCVDNRFYDAINMGSDNLVNSTFMYIFSRRPTRFELTEGKKIVEDQAGILFNEKGEKHDDYFTILFNSDEYKEGQVHYWFRKLVYREPTVDEVLALAYSGTFDVKELIAKIIVSKEFAKF